jgi:hypothetical protein
MVPCLITFEHEGKSYSGWLVGFRYFGPQQVTQFVVAVPDIFKAPVLVEQRQIERHQVLVPPLEAGAGHPWTVHG